ncbi:class I SAM-dependent methyltransferase [Agrobacterium sp.]|uniref:class I SAM-dependent methyltransferase n=1 Tax=Agrobacterium sp. TaxID=361 RepID=UPI0028AE49E0|nr:class I SAM-dependent methyltransferase [Agrobacterium sp.]
MSGQRQGFQSLDSNEQAGLMDDMYRYQRYIYDLTRKYYLLGRDGTITGLNIPVNGTMLEVGCGTGRNLLLTRKAFPSARLFGLDISAQMLETAAANFRSESEKPVFRVADATAFNPADFGLDGGFDRIMISYALSMIPDWQGAIDASLAALAPSGSLHIVDFGQQERLPALFRRLLRGWLTRFHVTPRADLRQVLEDRLSRHDASLRFETIGGGYAWRAVITKAAGK